MGSSHGNGEAESLLGPIMIAGIINSFVYGVSLLQVIQYYWARHKDPWLMRVLVFWMFVVDTSHTAAVMYMMYAYGVTNFMNTSILTATMWPFTTTPIWTGENAIPVQHLFAWRIKASTQSWAVFAVISFLSLAGGGLGLANAIAALRNPSVYHYRQSIPLGDTWIAVSLLDDAIISILLFIHLMRSRGITRSNTATTRFIRASAETTAYAVIFCVAELILFTASRDTNFHVMFAIPMGRLYSAALLASLNSRSTLRDELVGTGLAFRSAAGNRFELSMKPTEVTIAVEREIQMDDGFGAPSARKQGLLDLERSGFI
ncbi:hypothetical protein SCP_1004650 [Sparassis crispa]|uniref:DUF6534 domain-containing protein n=1 Tax=Sparassis crispa TaxID=139825 RepID=A0A401GYC3_9APHY|nr:hypothetical protein SCP_1004650 [Sparassis crispa]GBE87218.1 hypothetical protein SCP_1004650 [Sparassis crispa]